MPSVYGWGWKEFKKKPSPPRLSLQDTIRVDYTGFWCATCCVNTVSCPVPTPHWLKGRANECDLLKASPETTETWQSKSQMVLCGLQRVSGDGGSSRLFASGRDAAVGAFVSSTAQQTKRKRTVKYSLKTILNDWRTSGREHFGPKDRDWFRFFVGIFNVQWNNIKWPYDISSPKN